MGEDMEQTREARTQGLRGAKGARPSEPLVSVLCITYNQVDYIGQALESFIAQQTSFPFEILVNDDCSTDGTTELVLSYQERYPDLVQVVTHETNQYSQGVMPAESFLVPRARGRYLALCEGDDYFCDHTKLQRQVEVLEGDPELMACVHASENVQASTGRRLSTMAAYASDCAVDASDVLTRVQCFATNTLLMRKDAFLAYASSPERQVADDGDHKLMTYFATHGKGMWYINRIMSSYRFLAKSSINRTTLQGNELEAVSAARRDRRIELLRVIDEETEGRYHAAVLVGIDCMRYAYYKDMRDYRTLRARWPRKLRAESLPARLDLFLYTYLRPLHSLAYSLYYRL
jgi:glycosyltransferase involved in cell wall biosynthesis